MRLGYKKIENIPDYYENIINYPCKPVKNSTATVGMINMYLDRKKTPEQIVRECNQQVLNYFRNHFTVCAFHFVIEFAPSELAHLNDQQILEIGYKFALKEFGQYQVYFGIHDHSMCKHIDMVVFSTNIYDGSALNFGPQAPYKMASDLVLILTEYRPKGAITKPIPYQMR